MFREASRAVLEIVLAPVRLACELSRKLEARLIHAAVDPNKSRQELLQRAENGVTW